MQEDVFACLLTGATSAMTWVKYEYFGTGTYREVAGSLRRPQ
jgi:hypothetical protein